MWVLFVRDGGASNCAKYAMSEFWLNRMREALTGVERAEVMAFWADYVQGGVIKRYCGGGLRVKQRLTYFCVELMMTMVRILKLPC